MPLTRARSQSVIDFPAKKSTRRTRKSLLTEENVAIPKVSSPRKRRAKIETTENSCSPAKSARSAKLQVQATDQNDNNNIIPLKKSIPVIMSPVSQRAPLSPIKQGNIIYSSPLKSPRLHECGKALKSPLVKVLKSPLTVSVNTYGVKPVNQINPVRAIKFGNEEDCVLRKTPELSKVASSIRALNFSSATGDTDNTPLTPVKSPRKLTFESTDCGINIKETPCKYNSLKHAVRESPRKSIVPSRESPRKPCMAAILESPRKGNPLLQSPRKHPASPRKPDLVCQSPRKLMPFRLAKQESVCYQQAKQALHTALPERLLCREKEYKEVNDFLDGCLKKKKPGSMYISGAPGTGKTAVLSRTLHRLEEEDICQVIYVNCMSVKNSQAIYNKILGEIKGKDCSLSMKEASKQLEKCLTTKGHMICLIMDECDQLDSKNQEVLYTMFEWPHLAKSRLVLIGIANALDLTDRILPRLQARPKCKPKLMNFPPYSKDQIVTIIKDRLAQTEVNGEPVLDPMAIQFCARKVSAVAGDMRKALDVCRRAVEVVENEVRKQQIISLGTMSPSKKPGPLKKIGVAHIMKIINEVYGSGVSVGAASQNNTVPLQQKLAICSLLLTLNNGKAKEVPLGKLHENYCKVCKKQEMPTVDQSEFMSLCSLIEARGIMGMKRGKDTRQAKVFLKLDQKELELTLQDKTLMSSILQRGL